MKPKSFKRQLAENLWWLAILRLIVGLAMLVTVGDLDSSSDSAAILLMMFGLIAGLTVPAIYPLKWLEREGWILLFLTMPVQAIGIGISIAISSNWILIGALISAGIVGAILLSIKNYFN